MSSIISRRLVAASSVCVALSLAACERVVEPPPTTGIPVAVAAFGRSAPENVLSARVMFIVSNADSARVRYQSVNGPIQTTPFHPAKDGTDTVIVLGLRPNTLYRYDVEAIAAGVARRSGGASFQTDTLPPALADLQMAPLSGGASRYALTAINSDGSYAVAFDASGALVWYHNFSSAESQVGNVIRQPNGNFTAFLGTTTGWQAVDGYFVEFTPEGKEVATYTAPSDYFMDGHELLLTGDGSTKKAHFFTYDIRTLDLTSIGGQSSAQTAGHQLVRANVSGSGEWKWNAWDHIGVDEWVTDAGAKARASNDYDHPNAVTFDANGNYVVSWRNLNQIMAIDSHSGAVLWRLGGAKGDYKFVADPLGGFSKQHAVKILPNGNVLLFDNGSDHSPPQSRAVEYRLDPVAKTATMVWESRHDPLLYAMYVGWVERLQGGNTWIGYTMLGRVVEVAPGGQVVWEGQLKLNGGDAFAYRIVPLTSLY
jgi:Arylsulfotransferase (ASST)